MQLPHYLSGIAVNLFHGILAILCPHSIGSHQKVAPLLCFHRMMQSVICQKCLVDPSQIIHIFIYGTLWISPCGVAHGLFHVDKMAFLRWKNTISFYLSAQIIADLSLAVKHHALQIYPTCNKNIFKTRIFVHFLHFYHASQIPRQCPGAYLHDTAFCHLTLFIQQFDPHRIFPLRIQAENRHTVLFLLRQFIGKIRAGTFADHRYPDSAGLFRLKQKKSCQRCLPIWIYHHKQIRKLISSTLQDFFQTGIHTAGFQRRHRQHRHIGLFPQKLCLLLLLPHFFYSFLQFFCLPLSQCTALCKLADKNLFAKLYICPFPRFIPCSLYFTHGQLFIPPLNIKGSGLIPLLHIPLRSHLRYPVPVPDYVVLRKWNPFR